MSSRAITLLGWFGIVRGFLGMVYVALLPALQRAMLRAKLSEFGAEGRVDEMVEMQWRQERWEIVIAGVLVVAGIVAGIGLLRRREWARKTWLLVCTAQLILTIISGVFPGPVGWDMVPHVTFVLAVLVVSWWILIRVEIRREFVSAS